MSSRSSVQSSISRQKSLSQDFIEDLRDYERFDETFMSLRDIGAGSDGQVRQFIHKSSRNTVARKVPVDNDKTTHARIITEIRNLERIGGHEHILGMLTYVLDFPHLGPAIFLPVCDLGNLCKYVEQWREQEVKNHRPKQVAELTVWKLFHDMVLALDHLHNNLGTCYVHQDLKPQNILVQTPAGYTGRSIPIEPIFLVCDFARMTPYLALPHEETQPWFGTPEFAPPIAEQKKSIHPSGDIWTLGTTIQYFALNIVPRQSRQSFIRDRMTKGKSYPDIGDKTRWREGHWRNRIPTVYRPLDVSGEVLVQRHDAHGLLSTYQPLSKKLNDWYKKPFELDRNLRITSAELVREFVPLAVTQMAKFRKEQQVSGWGKIVERIPDDALDLEGSKENWKNCRAPSYKGTGCGPSSNERTGSGSS